MEKVQVIGDHCKKGKNEIAVQIAEAQRKWGEGIVKIGKAYYSKGYESARKVAQTFIEKYYYNGEDFQTLFLPTLATVKPFRLDFEGALSYFVGGNPNYPEDKGFALKPYIHVAWENAGVRVIGDVILAVGHYYFYDAPDHFTKVEYSFAYLNKEDGLKILLQDSNLPNDLKAE